MRNKYLKKAFTLAEIMIVLAVIGILTAIMLPTAYQSTPDEDVMKFKKINANLYKIIAEISGSGKYCAAGDLGKTADGSGELITSTTHFCKSIADILSVKQEHCSGGGAAGSYLNLATYEDDQEGLSALSKFQQALDSTCKSAQATIGDEIVTTDDVVWFEASPATPFGATTTINEVEGIRIFSDPESTPADDFKDSSGFDAVYKVYCIDLDGGDGSASDKSEPPFGYGIRSDGKIMPGERAIEWTKKKLQNKD